MFLILGMSILGEKIKLKNYSYVFTLTLTIILTGAQLSLGEESCRLLSTDFGKVAQENRNQDKWPIDSLIRFLSGPALALSPARVMQDGESQQCFSYQEMLSAKTFQNILLELNSLDTVLDSQWKKFIDACNVLTCESIIELGKPVECPKERLNSFIEGARLAALQAVIYDPRYVRLDTIGGDPDPSRGVCSDVVVRGLRKAGFDLQSLVHSDMKLNPKRYPLATWNQTKPDRNIDHRRVLNLMAYFKGNESEFATLDSLSSDFQPGDIVAWNLRSGNGFLAHIGVVSDRKGDNGYLVIHHLGGQGEEADVLLRWPRIGHFRLR